MIGGPSVRATSAQFQFRWHREEGSSAPSVTYLGGVLRSDDPEREVGPSEVLCDAHRMWKAALDAADARDATVFPRESLIPDYVTGEEHSRAVEGWRQDRDLREKSGPGDGGWRRVVVLLLLAQSAPEIAAQAVAGDVARGSALAPLDDEARVAEPPKVVARGRRRYLGLCCV